VDKAVLLLRKRYMWRDLNNSFLYIGIKTILFSSQLCVEKKDIFYNLSTVFQVFWGKPYMWYVLKNYPCMFGEGT